MPHLLRRMRRELAQIARSCAAPNSSVIGGSSDVQPGPADRSNMTHLRHRADARPRDRRLSTSSLIMFARAAKQWTTIQCCQNGPSFAKNCILQFIFAVYGVFRCLTEDSGLTSMAVPFRLRFIWSCSCGDITMRPHRH